MGATNLKELLTDFRAAFNEESWLQTEDQKRVLASVKRVLSSKQEVQGQCQTLLKILYQCQQQNVADHDQIYKLILGVLTTWLIQGKPDRIKVQAIISDLLDSDWFKKRKNDPKLLELIRDLTHIGAQMAYYRIDDAHRLSGEQAKIDRPKQRARQFERFAGQDYGIISGALDSKFSLYSQEKLNFFTELRNALNEFKHSKTREKLEHLPIQSLFRQFFSSNTYDAQEFERYQTFIKDWLANKSDKDQADEILLIHILRCGVEQVSKERESAGLGQGYKLFSTSAEKFMQFLTQIHQQHGLPNPLRLQELQEEIAIGQAKLLEAISDPQAVFSLAEKLLAIAHHCDMSSERQNVFHRRLFEIGVEKCSFMKSGQMSIPENDLIRYNTWSVLESFSKLHHLDQSTLHSGEMPRAFWHNFFLTFIQAYREQQVKVFLAHKDFKSIWVFCENIAKLVFNRNQCGRRLSFGSHGAEHSVADAFLINSLIALLKETMRDCQASLTTLDDYLQYIQAAIAIKPKVIGFAYKQPFLNSRHEAKEIKEDTIFEKDSIHWEFELIPDEAYVLHPFLGFDEKRLSGLLKTRSDYKKLLKVLAVDLLEMEQHKYIDFAIDQIDVLMGIDPEMTISVLYELKREYSTELKEKWHSIESDVLAPERMKRSPLLAVLLNVTKHWEYKDEIFIQVGKALNDETLRVNLVTLDSSSSQSTQTALTTALIQLLQTFYKSLNVSQVDDKHWEKQLVADMLIFFMMLQKPTAENYQTMIFALYALKQKYQFKHDSFDARFITDLLIIRAQSLHTVEEFTAFADLLKTLQKQYPFPEASIEQTLKAAVENHLSLLEHPNTQNSSNTQPIAEFKPQALLGHFDWYLRYLSLFRNLAALRKAYQLSTDEVDKVLMKKLLVAGIASVTTEKKWEAYHFSPSFGLSSVFRFCEACEGDSGFINTIFSILEGKLKSYEVLKELGKGRFEQQFVRYVLDKQAKRIFEAFEKASATPDQCEATILRGYDIFNAQGMPELMPSDFLRAYFAHCGQFTDYRQFAEFVLYKIPYEDKEAPELLKQLSEKLSVIEYDNLIRHLIEYAKRNNPSTDKLEHFLLTTLETVAKKAVHPTDRTQLPKLLERFEEKNFKCSTPHQQLKKNFKCSTPHQQLKLTQLIKKIATGQLQENLLAVESVSEELRVLEIPKHDRDIVEKLKGYEENKKASKLIKRVAKYDEDLADAKTNCHQQIQSIKGKEVFQNSDEINIAKLCELTGESENAKLTVETGFQTIKTTHQNLIQDIPAKVNQIEDALKKRYTDSSANFEKFLLNKTHGQKDEKDKTELEKRADLETKRKTTHGLIEGIKNRSELQATSILDRIDQEFILLDQAITKKQTGLDQRQTTITRLINQYQLLQAQPNIAFKTLSDKLTELEQAITSAEENLQKLPTEFQTAEEALKQANAWAEDVKKQEALHQNNFEEIQKNCEQILLQVEQELHKDSERFEDYQKQTAKFRFEKLNVLDETSRAVFLGSEQRLVRVFTAIEPRFSDWSKQYQTERGGFQTKRQKMSETLLDSKLSLIERETLVKQFEFEKDQVDQTVKGFAPQIIEIETRLNEAQAELAIQSEHIIKTFDEQIKARVLKAQTLENEIAAQLAEEKRLNEAIKDNGEKDAWVLRQLEPLKETLPLVLPEGNIADSVLNNLKMRNIVLHQIMDAAAQARVDIEAHSPLTLKTVQNFAKEVLPKMRTYRERLQKLSEHNYIPSVLANAVLTIFDHGFLSQLPFVAPLKRFMEEQKQLADYTNHLMQIETQFGQVATLQSSLSVETDLSLQMIHNQFQGSLTTLQTQCDTFLTQASKTLIEDALEQAKVASIDSKTKIIAGHQSNPNWLLSEATDLVTSMQTFIKRLSDTHADYTQYQQAGDCLEQGYQEQTRLNELTVAIEKITEAKAQNEQTLRQVQIELTALTTEKQRFTDEAEADRYQAKLKAYRTQAEDELSPLGMLFTDDELSPQQKTQLFNDLVQSHPDCVNQLDEKGQTPLHLAVKLGDIQWIERLLKLNANPHVRDEEGKTPLVLALLLQQKEVVSCLKQYGAQSYGIEIHALLKQIIQKNDVAYVQFLLAEKDWLNIDVNHRDESGKSFLQQAVNLGQVEMVELLLKAQANPNFQDLPGNTALHDAVKQKNLALVKLLFTHGANPSIQNAQNKTALDDPESKNVLLHLAAKAGDVGLVEQLIRLGANIHSVDDQKETALHGAVKGGHQKMVRKLLQKGVNPNRQNTQGDTPLHLALSLGHTDIAKRLLRAKNLNINLVNSRKETLLHLAIQHRQPVMGQLLAKGIDIDAQTDQGETALSLAVSQGNVNLVKWLFLKGARLDICNQAGATAFNTVKGRALFKQLVPSTEKLNLADKKRILRQGGGHNLLYLAIEEGNTGLLQWLVDAQGVDINVYDGEGRTLLNLLSQPNYFNVLSQDCYLKEVERLLGVQASTNDLVTQELIRKSKRQVYLEYLIERGAHFWKAQDSGGNHLLHLLVAQGFHDELVKDLVNRWGFFFFRKNAVLNALNSQGETLLHLAIKQGNIELVALLVEKGARLDVVNREGEKPFDTQAGMAMYLILKGEVIEHQQLHWFKQLKKWMEGRDYSGLLNQIEAEQQATESQQKAQSSLFEEAHEHEETLFTEKSFDTNPFVVQEKSIPEQSTREEEENKTSWLDQVAREMQETSLFETSTISTNPFETASKNPFAEINLAKNSELKKDTLKLSSPSPVEAGPATLLGVSVLVYPSVFKPPVVPKASKKPEIKFMLAAELTMVGDVFDRALNQGQYEKAKQLLKGNRGYQGNLSFQNLPRVMKRYLLLDNKDLQKENILARARKSLRLEEAYIEKQEALYQAVVNSDSAFVAAWFEAQAKHISQVQARVQKGEKGAKEALALLNSQLFEVIHLQREGVTLSALLIEREKTRQLHASSENESEATENALRRYHDGAILRILMAYIPKSVVLPIVAEGLALYDLAEPPEWKPSPLPRVETEDDLDLEYAEEAAMKFSHQLPGWLGDAQKLFNEVTGFVGKTLDETKEKLTQTQEKMSHQVSQTVLGQKDLIEVYAYHRPTAPSTQTLASECYDLYVMAFEKLPSREALDSLFYQEKNPDQQKLPMLIRHQNHLWFYGLTSGGMTLLAPLSYEKHQALYDKLLPEHGYDLVVIPKPLSTVGKGEQASSDPFNDQELGVNEFRIRWDQERAALCYRVKDAEGVERSGLISTKEHDELWDHLGGDKPNSRYVEFLDALEASLKGNVDVTQLLKPYVPTILKITHDKKHTAPLKLLPKAEMPIELYETINSIKGHIHGMLSADERLKQGKALAEKMSSWIEEEMGKNFKGADVVDVRDKEGNTLLHLAVRDNLDVVVEWLLPSSLTQDVKNWGERTLADVQEKLVSAGASGTGSVLGIVASAAVGTVVTGATLPVLGPFSIAAGVLAGKLTALFVENGSQLMIEKMYGIAQEKILLSLEQRIDVRHQNHVGDTALHIAARTMVENNLWIVSVLLAKAKPEDLNITNQKGDTPLHLAVKHRNAHIVALLILAGANPNMANREGKTALHLAATSGDETLFQMLIESGANVYAQTQLGQTVEQLLTKKISLLDEQMRKETNQPERLIQLADEKARYERMLNCLYKDQSLLKKAKSFHDENQMKEMEQQKEVWWDKAQETSRQRAEKVVEADERGNTLLHVLVQNKANYELVKDLLIHYEVKDLNRANHEGNTPLHLAVLHGGGTGTNAKMIRLLLAHGANRYATNHDNKMPIELVPDERYQYKIDEVFNESRPKPQKKDKSDTEFFKPKTETSASSGQPPLDIPTKTKGYHPLS